jgi:hypothetical protein
MVNPGSSTNPGGGGGGLGSRGKGCKERCKAAYDGCVDRCLVSKSQTECIEPCTNTYNTCIGGCATP